ncbi:uncharacterized protein [Rutidosis leptorrhynchoides]|uniref:uncharacterized protein n=1 Tax=Rutidosis leptorrhynchoides TaxID=125765 RepID=UPI003A9937D4
MREFKECLDGLHMTDVNHSGLHFTWNQWPSSPTGLLKKIDRVMANDAFIESYTNAYAIFQPYRILDHTPAVLKIPCDIASKPKPFKFSNYIVNHVEFINVSSFKKLRERESIALNKYNEAVLEVENFLKQKAKIEWLRVGVSNLNYFQKVIKAKTNRRKIQTVADANGKFVEGKEVSNLFVQHYMDFLGDSKSPGPDGYSAAFFKKSWDIIGDDVTIAVQQFFINGKMLTDINSMLITLLPKVQSPSKVTDYRPISCWNVIYKSISKVITNQIKLCLEDVVNVNQSAFIPGRKISDNVLLTQ